MPRSAQAIRFFIPGRRQWRCMVAGCDERTDQRHHADYKADERWSHRRFPICERHHSHLHQLWNGMKRGVPLALFTLNYVVDPQSTALDAIALMDVVPARAQQLSFADLPTREGEFWRAWADVERQADADDEMTFGDRDAA